MGLSGRRSGRLLGAPADPCRPARPGRRMAQQRCSNWPSSMDDDVMEAYLEGNEPSDDVLRELIRKGTLAMTFVPILAGSAFKNKGVQPMLNAVIDYLPNPLDVPPYMGFAPGDETETRNIERSADDSQPFSALAFKIMNDPFVGSLTFTRIYSGQLKKGDQMMNATKERRERVGRMMMMHAINREEIDEAFAGDIIALAGLKETTTGRHALRSEQAGRSGNHDLPAAGDRDRRRAEDQGRPGKDGHRSGPSGRRRPVLPRRNRPRIGPDHHEGHGRTSPRHPRRPHAARVQGRGEHRCAAGGLPRDDQPRSRDRLHPQEADRRYGPVRPHQAGHLADRAGRGLFVRKQGRRRLGAEGIHPRRRKGHQVGDGFGPAGRLPGDRLQGGAGRRRLPRRRLLGAGLRDRGACRRCATA